MMNAVTFCIIIYSPILFAVNLDNGNEIVSKNCQGCHSTGLLNSPKIGDTKDWKARSKQGYSILVKHAVNGFNSMPAKGGLMHLTVTDIEDAVASLLNSSGISISNETSPKNSVTNEQLDKSVVPVEENKTPIKSNITDQAQNTKEKLQKQILASKKANKFNRLMQPKSDWNQPPSQDGIHDEDNDGTYILQSPREAFSDLSKSSSGNHVNWVKSLNDGSIAPRFDLNDPDKQPFVMDLDIVREVKGSMPDVVYPHKAHTQWLDCSNCHPAIFIPKKGANQISMASILMGEQCGVCHGKVAFPVSECRLCHSKKKSRLPIKKSP